MGRAETFSKYAVVGSVATAVLALTGCTTSSRNTTMMGGPTGAGTFAMANQSGSAPAGVGSNMMGAGSGTHFSRLTCAAPTSLPGSVVRVTLADMGMSSMTSGTAPMGAHMTLQAAPESVPAGQVTIVASNVGWRTHELVILPLTAGAQAGQLVPKADGKVSETGSLGESSKACAAGSGEGLKAGTVGWTTVKLAAGHYELVCNLANHYADGMHQELVVR